MKIAIDVRSLMEGRHSGVEEYTTQIVRALLRVGAEHEYHLFYNSGRAVRLPEFGEDVAVHGLRYPNKLLNAAQYATRWPKWDTLLAKSVIPDVFFVPNARLLPVSPGVKYVVTAHDLSYERFPEFYSARRRVWHRLMRPRVLMNEASHVIAVSRATKDDVVQLYRVPQDEVSVVYSGVSLSGSGESSALTGLPEKFVLYLGTLEPRKNVVSIVEAFSAIAGGLPHDLVIAGERGWLKKDVEQAIERSSVQERIHRLGFVSEQDKQALYSAADLFVYPSFYEGFGFPPLESLMASTPVITSMNSSLPEIVGEWAALVNPYDVSELALIMKELLLDNPGVSPDVQQNIRDRYSWDRAARETLSILTSVA